MAIILGIAIFRISQYMSNRGLISVNIFFFQMTAIAASGPDKVIYSSTSMAQTPLES